MPSAPTSADARTIARISADEMVSALGLSRAPSAVQGAARAAFMKVSFRLGRVLARFDSGIGELGIARAAARALADLEASVTRFGPAPPTRGPLLVVANHPGAYDALVLMAALGRDDVAILAADRPFLRALPELAKHFFFVPEAPSAAHERTRDRASALRRALRHFERGGALVHFGAGCIEPDPAFAVAGAPDLLAPWRPGTGALVHGVARREGVIVAAIVSGVHSARAKGLLVTRLAERRGVTTLAPLLQIAFGRYREVRARVRFGVGVPARELARYGDNAVVTERARNRARELLADDRGAGGTAGREAAERVAEGPRRVDPARESGEIGGAPHG
jgi:Acyltransferase